MPARKVALSIKRQRVTRSGLAPIEAHRAAGIGTDPRNSEDFAGRSRREPVSMRSRQVGGCSCDDLVGEQSLFEEGKRNRLGPAARDIPEEVRPNDKRWMRCCAPAPFRILEARLTDEGYRPNNG